MNICMYFFFFFQAEDGIRDLTVTGVQTCALPICPRRAPHGNGHPRDQHRDRYGDGHSGSDRARDPRGRARGRESRRRPSCRRDQGCDREDLARMKSIRDFDVLPENPADVNKTNLQAAIDWASPRGAALYVEPDAEPYRLAGGVLLKMNTSIIGAR